jgi:hypothetical protein
VISGSNGVLHNFPPRAKTRPAPSILSSDFANLASEAERMVLPRRRLAPWYDPPLITSPHINFVPFLINHSILERISSARATLAFDSSNPFMGVGSSRPLLW